MNTNKRLKIPQRTHPLVTQLFEIVRDHPYHTLRSATETAGLGVSAMGHWARYHVPSLTNFDAALGALGYKLAIVPLDAPETPL